MKKIFFILLLLSTCCISASSIGNFPIPLMWQYDNGDSAYHHNDWTAPIWAFRVKYEGYIDGTYLNIITPIPLPSPFYTRFEFTFQGNHHDINTDPHGILTDIAFGSNSDFKPIEQGGDWVLLTAYLGDGSKELLDILSTTQSSIHQKLKVPTVVLYNVKTGIIRYM